MPRITRVDHPVKEYKLGEFQSSQRKRVAGYARVSTDDEEQLSSYEAQLSYYSDYIKNNPAWMFVNVYCDEGLSAVTTKHRDGFNDMIQDALDGKIDMIVTKSISRFARNTVDTLITIRKLRDKGISVYFEKESLDSSDPKCELMLSIMSSIAQEESRSISENVTWGWRKRIADGKVSMSYGRFLGYEKGEDGIPRIVEEEAQVVRLIYRMYLDGASFGQIAKYLMDTGVPTPGGKQKWWPDGVQSILTNVKYKGDALLQIFCSVLIKCTPLDLRGCA